LGEMIGRCAPHCAETDDDYFIFQGGVSNRRKRRWRRKKARSALRAKFRVRQF
jgi:hypothetical protein